MSSSWVLAIVAALGLVTIGHCRCPAMQDLPNNVVASSERASKCYALVTENVLFGQAENACKRSGGHLASVHSKETNAVLMGLMKTASYSGYSWIGFSNDNEFNTMAWIDHTDIDYLNWGEGHAEDNEHVSAACATIHFPSGKWYRWHCIFPEEKFANRVHAYICEYNDTN